MAESTELTNPNDVPASSRRSAFARSAWPVILLLLVTAAAYWPTFGNGFVRLDDHVTVYENKLLLHLNYNGFCSFWTGGSAGLYVPLSYSLLAAISVFSRAGPVNGQEPPWAFKPGPFHAVDLLLHLASVAVVYALLLRLVRRRWPAAGGAAIFALHPMQVESVAWISETSNVLCGFLSFGAIWLYLQSIPRRDDPAVDQPDSLRRRKSFYILATEVFLLALVAKPVAVVVPLLVGTVDGLARKTKGVPWNWIAWLGLSIPFAIIAQNAQPIPEWWPHVRPSLHRWSRATRWRFICSNSSIPACCWLITTVPQRWPRRRDGFILPGFCQC